MISFFFKFKRSILSSPNLPVKSSVRGDGKFLTLALESIRSYEEYVCIELNFQYSISFHSGVIDFAISVGIIIFNSAGLIKGTIPL